MKQKTAARLSWAFTALFAVGVFFGRPQVSLGSLEETGAGGAQAMESQEEAAGEDPLPEKEDSEATADGTAIQQSSEVQMAADEVTLEKSAAWTDAGAYQAEITLHVTGVEKYTRNQQPIQVIPVLDMTNSMNCCETEGHVRPLLMHAISAIPGYKELWEEIRDRLPTKEEYTSLGAQDPANLFLMLPEEWDPTHRARLFCCQRNGTDIYNQDVLGGWKVVYVTEDQTPLWDVAAEDFTYLYHCLEQDGIYTPIGTMVEKEKRTVWKSLDSKTEAYGCVHSRMDDLVEGYSQFLAEIFENEDARVCPVAFIGGYYLGGWMSDPAEALSFVTEKGYLQAEQTAPEGSTGTNLEAAVAGAREALARAESQENTFVLIFTDGAATSAYYHGEDGSIDPSRLDPHSYQQAEWDPAYYPQFGLWAVEDAAPLKAQVPVYTVGYGYSMKYDDASQETLRQLSSGEGCFIDTREESLSEIMEIFQTVYSDLIAKATMVQTVDYLSEYWEPVVEELPYGCKAEEIPIVNQKGEADRIWKLTFPITKEMGADDEETFVIPVTLREPYREVAQETAYPTNQDEPLSQPEGGTGAKVYYRNPDGAAAVTGAASPALSVYPPQADFSLEKTALTQEAKAGESVRYEITLRNLGQPELTNLVLTDVFEAEGVQCVFEEAEGLTIREDGSAVLALLPRGKTVTLYVTAKLPQELQGELVNVVTARATGPLGELTREARASIQTEAAALDFEVEKTADREIAAPGDRVNYQITIRNTGERTLHSIVTVDRFLSEGVTAAFEEQEGVILDEAKETATIPQLPPGETAVLSAWAVIPEDFQEESLVNVALVSVEDEEQSVTEQGESEIEIQQPETPAPTETPKAQETDPPAETQEPEESPKVQETPGQRDSSSSKLTSGYSSQKGTVSSQPKTGDETPIAFWGLVGAAGGLGVLLLLFFLHRKGKVEKRK